MIKKDPQEELDEQIKKKLADIEKSLSKKVTPIPKGEIPIEPATPTIEPTLPPTTEPLITPEPTPEQTTVVQPLPKTEPARPVEPISPPPAPPKPETATQPKEVIEKKGDEAGALIAKQPEPLKDIGRYPPVDQTVKRELDRIDETIAGMETTTVDDLAVHVPFRRVLPGGGNYSDFAFGFSISGAVVSVNHGYVFHGVRTAIVAYIGNIGAASEDVVVVADNTYIYVSYVFGSGEARIKSSTVFPQHTSAGINWLLYKARLITGVASISGGDIHHLGSITIPGAFA